MVGLGESNIYQNLKDFTRIGDSCYRVDVTFHKINKFFNSKFLFSSWKIDRPHCFIKFTHGFVLHIKVLFHKRLLHCIKKYCCKVSLFITWYKDSLKLFWGYDQFQYWISYFPFHITHQILLHKFYHATLIIFNTGDDGETNKKQGENNEYMSHLVSYLVD